MTTPQTDTRTVEVSLVCPMMNEEDTLRHFFDQVQPLLAACSEDYEMIVVNDGSTDGTLAGLLRAQETLEALQIVDLSRNFGKEAALTAGLAHARGDAVIIIDADLQDPPELIPEMLAHWREGYDLVTHVRSNRDSDGRMKRSTAKAFYSIINRISDMEMTPNAGDYRLLTRAAVQAFLSLPERTRFNKGLFQWVGFREKLLYHPRAQRSSGETKWNYRKLFGFAIDGITSFSSLPLKIWSWLGFALAVSAFIYGVVIVVRTLVYGIDQPGYASLMAVILFFNGITLIGIGIIGEYLARVFIETKQRPLYIVRRIYASPLP